MRGKRCRVDLGVSGRRIIPAPAGQTRLRPGIWRIRSDHPRTCGANDDRAVRTRRPPGSSPHMRGKPQAGHRRAHWLRIIPAHAGQTAALTGMGLAYADHPRTCGANPCHIPFTWLMVGSSPHMRGKRTVRDLRTPHRRIIPAHAGQTLLPLTSRHVRTDHPRTCGANADETLAHLHQVGSSPHMRGKPVRSGRPTRRVRIIPAHAGQTHLAT